MHIGRLLNPSTESHPPKSSAGNSANNLQPVAKTISASTPSINVHETTATIEAPVPDLDAIAESALPYPRFDDMYDDERHPSPEVKADSDQGLSNLPPSKESKIRSGPSNGEPSPQLTSPAKSHTSPAAPTLGVNVHGTTAASASGPRRPTPAWLGRRPPIASRPIDTTTAGPSSGNNIYGTASSNYRDGLRRPAPLPAATSPLTSRRPDLAVRSFNQIPDVAEIIDVDASVTRPNTAVRPSNGIPDVAEIIDVDASVTLPNTTARASNRTPDVAEIIDVDASVTRPNAVARSSDVIPDLAEIIDIDAGEARRRTQVTPPTSGISMQVGSSAPGTQVQASGRTLSESEQIAVEVLASNSRSREISQGPSGSRTRSNATAKDDKPFPRRQEEPWYHLDTEIARENENEDFLGADLLCTFANDCHKRNEIRKGKQREEEAPLLPLVSSIEDDSSSECESCDEECEACDEAAANMEYIYNVRARPQTRPGNELETIRAHPGNAVWALVESRLGPVNDPHKWETACNRCNPLSEEQREEQREQTISLEEAVDETGNQIEGAAPYNPALYTTTSPMRELRVKPQKSKAELKDMAKSSNLSASSPSDQASSSGSNAKGKQKANGDGNSNERQPTPRLPSARATSSRIPGRGTKEGNGDINSDASGIHACSPPRPPSPTRTSLRNRQLFGPQPRVPRPPLPPAPVIASSSRRSKCYIPSPLGQYVDRINATTPEQSQTFSNNATKEADNDDAEQGKRGATKEKKSVNGDSKEAGKANNKRKASEAVEDADAGSSRVTRSRRKLFPNSSNGSNELGASQIASDPVTRSTSRATAPRSEGSSERRVRLRLRVSAEANPEHPDHERYLTTKAMRKEREKE